MCRDFVHLAVDCASDRAEPFALGPHGIGELGNQRFDLGRTSIRGRVEVRFFAQTAGPVITNDTAHKEEAMAGFGKSIANRLRRSDDLSEPDGKGHDSSSRIARAAATTSAPGPPEVGASGRCVSPTSAAATADEQSLTASRS